jgi:phosphate transport system substrate-binding protein
MKKILILLAVVTAFTACKSGSKKKGSDEKSAKTEISLSAAGSTFAGPFYKTAFKKYYDLTGVQTSYGLTGSGAGIRSLKDRVVDFCGSDAFLSDAEAAQMPAPVVHVATCSGAVDIAFNVPGVDSIKLDQGVLADIFLGKITNWNDARLKALNPGIQFPDLAISVVHRSDGSGTTFIFSDYMSKISKEWKDNVGVGKSLNWPTGMGAKGNPGVAGTISSTVGAIGYIGSDYAFAQKISFALLKNAAGNYVAPTIAAVSAAGKGDMPADTRIMETNSSAPDAYPISGFTWIILYKEQAYNGRSLAQAQATVKLIDWMLDPAAQAIGKELNYAPLPEKVVKIDKAILRTVTYNGKPILK